MRIFEEKYILKSYLRFFSLKKSIFENLLGLKLFEMLFVFTEELA